MRNSRARSAAIGYSVCLAAQALLLLSLATIGVIAARAAPAQTHFATAQQAVDTLVQAVRNQDVGTLQAALGPAGTDLLNSGDPTQDSDSRRAFLAAYDENAKLVDLTSTKTSLEIGKDEWAFPIPLVHEAHGWRFDTAAGREELINRRIGQNELDVIQVCLAYVDAQREYATFDRNGDGILEYAQRFLSTENHRDGLYWPTSATERPSPLGDLVQDAKGKGYHLASATSPSVTQPQAYRGYHYRILTRQGANAEGGAFDYVVNGNMIGGFALVAFPATYGVSGVMTFIVNHDGTVYQKDLGPRTEAIALSMTTFDPDKSWKAEK